MNARNALRNGLLAASLAALPLAGASLTANAETQVRDGSLQQIQLEKGEKKHHGKHHKKHGERYGKKGGALGQLTYFEVQNLALESVAALSDQPLDQVRETAQDEGMRKLLKAYDISREAFAGEMAPKLIGLVKAAESKGRLTALQANALTGEIEARTANTGEENRKDRGRAMKDLAHMQTQNLAISVLAELSGKTPAEARLAVSELGPRLAISSFGIDKEAFREAMQTRTKALIEAAVAEGSITAEQAQSLEKRMEKGKTYDRG